MDDTIRKICREIADGTGEISRKEIMEALKMFKQKEREQRQEEYEEQLNYETEALLTLRMEQNQEKVKENVENILEKLQNMAFLDGFRYAISIFGRKCYTKRVMVHKCIILNRRCRFRGSLINSEIKSKSLATGIFVGKHGKFSPISRQTSSSYSGCLAMSQMICWTCASSVSVSPVTSM